MKIRITLILLFICKLIYPQLISGIIKDSVSGKKIQFANIVLKNGKGTYSDKSGKFILKYDEFESDSIKVSSIGFESKYLSISYFNKKNKKILLKKRVERLDEVILTTQIIEYSDKLRIGEKRNKNIGVTSLIGYETAIFIDNPKNTNGKLKRVYINLKKRKNADLLATFNLKFYKFDSTHNKPGKLLYNKNLFVKPKNKKYRLWIDIEELEIIFPKNGICIGVEFVNTHGEVHRYTKFGPMFRYTFSKNDNYFTWSNYHNSGWSEASIKHNKRKKGKSNPMIGIEALFPKK